MRGIRSITLESIGKIFAVDGEIIPFEVNGEMSPILWYRQGTCEWNGKYVIEVEYYPEGKSREKEIGVDSNIPF